MKRLKQLFDQVKDQQGRHTENIDALLWELICYSPKMPLRPYQQELLNEAKSFTLDVEDPHFSKSQLKFNGFVWGNGSRKVFITHGWGSKAADFADLIMALKAIDDLQLIAFDAPGNGSSEGELSNLLLFANAAAAVIKAFGTPEVMIGHSLGAMANAIAIRDTGIKPSSLISIAPLVKLKENFIASLNAAGVSEMAQQQFFKKFESLFAVQASYFALQNLYNTDLAATHRVAYDDEDKISPYPYLREFLAGNPAIKVQAYPAVGHERIIKDPALIKDLAGLIAN